MDLGTRKLSGSGETPRKPDWLEEVIGSPSRILGKPPNHCGRHLQRKLQIARKCDGVFEKTEPQQTLNSLFSCLGSSVKDT